MIFLNNKRLCLACSRTFASDAAFCPDDGSPLASVHDGPPPDLVPGYRLEREIGRGTSGKVYQAVENGTNRRVAIKILHQTLANDLEMLRRFKKEAELSSRLSSRNTVSVKHFGLISDGRPFIAMDFIDGETTCALIEKGMGLPFMRALPIFIQAAAGLAHAHKNCIMHRDIKPGNIMLTTENGIADVVKIVDFGIAKELQLGNNFTALTLPGEAIGSPMYMSPEQCLGAEIDHRTDIYSLACVMYEMLTGRPLFRAPTAMSVMTMQVRATPAPMNLPASMITAELERIVMKGLAKNPNERYMVMEELQRDLQIVFSRLQAQWASPMRTIRAS
ncbi:MAG: serine/threonine protein kinase [Cyanobacteria bacterium REEB67]|nr:serine/threonine protein kinase [Cyanobacteria bacterium REEB67]